MHFGSRFWEVIFRNGTERYYSKALDLLKDRFGNKKLIISKHMDALLGLEKVRSATSVKELRTLYDIIMVNIRALTAYDITSEQFGPMLSPVILQKLPSDIKLEVTRQLRNQDWNIDKLLEVLRVEIENQEACFNYGNNNKTEEIKKFPGKWKEHSGISRITTETLYVDGRVIKCVFCNGEHYADKC